MDIEEERIEEAAKAMYYANPAKLPWESLSDNVKDWMRRQAREACVFIERSGLGRLVS